MTYEELQQKTDSFVSKYLGQSKGYPDDSLYKGECLSICKLFIKEVFGISPPASGTNSAYGYWSIFPSPLDTAFDRVLNTTDLIPQKGWIGIMEPWKENPYGHIFIVADGSTKNDCKNWAQNWSSKKFQLESNKYTNIIGFLVPKINSSDNNMDITDEQKRVLEKLETYKNEAKHSSLEGALDVLLGNVTELRNSRETVSNLKKDLENCQEENTTLRKLSTTLSEKVAELTDKLAEEQKQAQTWQSQYTTANELLVTINEQLALVTKEKNDYQLRYQDAEKELKDLDNMTPFQYIIYCIKSIIINKQ